MLSDRLLFYFSFLNFESHSLNHWRHWSLWNSLGKAASSSIGTPGSSRSGGVYLAQCCYPAFHRHTVTGAVCGAGQKDALWPARVVNLPIAWQQSRYTWLHTSTNPALPTPVCPGCHGKENQVQRPDGKDMLQQVTSMHDTPKWCVWPYHLHRLVSAGYNLRLAISQFLSFQIPNGI